MKYSIIIPVYNAEAYLSDCLSSISNQPFTDYEVLLINDGSTDNSEQLCKKYSERDARFKLHSQKNSGSLAARKAGVSLAQGEYIMFLDADDSWQPNTLESIDTLIRENKPDLLVFHYQKIVDGMIVEIPPAFSTVAYFTDTDKQEYLYQWLKEMRLNSPWDKVVKREFIRPNFECYQQKNYVTIGTDLYQSIEIVKSVHSIVYTPQILYNYNCHAASISYTIRLKNIESTNLVYQFFYDYLKTCYGTDQKMMELFWGEYLRRIRYRTMQFYAYGKLSEIKIWNQILKKNTLYQEATHFPLRTGRIKSNSTQKLIQWNIPLLSKGVASVRRLFWKKNFKIN